MDDRALENGARDRKDAVSGFTHLAGLAVALVAVPLLLVRARGHVGTLASSCTFGVSLIALYAASSVYHLTVADERYKARLRLLDHIAIFLLIAGTCTPVFLRAFDGATRLWMMVLVWALAAAGIAFKLAWKSAPRLLYTAIYVAMGWLVVVRWGALAHALPPVALALVIAGGITYTLGAVVYASKRPNPFPSAFGFHEIWHFFVLGGSSLHFAAIAVLAA